MKTRDTIGFWRKRIDTVNRKILGLVNQRVRAACRIGAIKKQSGQAITDPARERAIIRGLLSANPGPADARAVKSIFSAIIRETKRLEKEHS
jgi:chorismate mutase